MSTVIAPVDRFVHRIQMWRYEEKTASQSRDLRNAGERLARARVSHLH